MKDLFNGHEEIRGKPDVVNAEEQVERAIEYKTWLDEGNKEGAVGDPSKSHGVKRKSILYNLPYWKVMVEHHLYINCLSHSRVMCPITQEWSGNVICVFPALVCARSLYIF